MYVFFLGYQLITFLASVAAFVSKFVIFFIKERFDLIACFREKSCMSEQNRFNFNCFISNLEFLFSLKAEPSFRTFQFMIQISWQCAKAWIILASWLLVKIQPSSEILPLNLWLFFSHRASIWLGNSFLSIF